MTFVARWPIAAYFAAILVPLLWWTDYWAYDTYIEMTKYGQGVGLFIVASSIFLTRPRVTLSLPSFPLIALFSWCFFSIFWSIDTSASIIGVASFAVFAVGLAGFWSLDDRAFNTAAITILVGLAVLMAVLGIDGRMIGGITPNGPAQLALAAIIFTSMTEKPSKIIIAIATLMIFQAQARTVLVALFLFMTFRYFIVPYSHRIRSPWVVALLVAGSGGIIFFLYDELLSLLLPVMSKLLGIDLQARQGADLTGRLEYWRIALLYFYENPIFGYGFRTRLEFSLHAGQSINAHSAAINLVLDLGVVGAFLYAMWYISSLFYSLRDQSRRGMSAAAGLISMLPLLYAEPLYIGWYNAAIFVILLFLVRPLAPVVRRAVQARRQMPDPRTTIAMPSPDLR